ncbi:GntR family transcriptional regulator [Rhizobium sp. NPDC090279]|uniref:GntR family transcriptional regulator n=1 Tax=Rhizobium sp. NPDC090279 TaxID=3364499 RepID=UPI00383BF024
MALPPSRTSAQSIEETQPTAWALEPTAPVGPQIYKVLRRFIVRGEFSPGTAMSEVDIAGRFATSRQPVREAFIKLAEDGLLEVRPQRGTFVRKISIAQVIDARFVREAIETSIVRELAAKGDTALIKRLRQQLKEQAAVSIDRPDDFMKLDEQFHWTLADAAGRSYGWKVIEDVKLQMDRVRHLTLKTFPQQRLVRQHAAIVDGIEHAAPDEAEREMRQHLQLILEDLPSVEKQHPDFFTPST